MMMLCRRNVFLGKSCLYSSWTTVILRIGAVFRFSIHSNTFCLALHPSTYLLVAFPPAFGLLLLSSARGHFWVHIKYMNVDRPNSFVELTCPSPKVDWTRWQVLVGYILRSVSNGDLVAPSSNMRTYGDRRFAVCVPKLWNSLPLSLSRSSSVDIFKNVLKTYLFKMFVSEINVSKCRLFTIHFYLL